MDDLEEETNKKNLLEREKILKKEKEGISKKLLQEKNISKHVKSKKNLSKEITSKKNNSKEIILRRKISKEIKSKHNISKEKKIKKNNFRLKNKKKFSTPKKIIKKQEKKNQKQKNISKEKNPKIISKKISKKNKKKIGKEITRKNEFFADEDEKKIFLTSLYNSLLNIANCFNYLRHYKEAKNCLLEALKISENYLLYFLLAQNIYCDFKAKISDLEESLGFIRKGIYLKKKDCFFKNSFNVLVAFNLHNLDSIFEIQEIKILELIEKKKNDERLLVNFVFKESLENLKNFGFCIFYKDNLKNESFWEKENLKNQTFLERVKNDLFFNMTKYKNLQNQKMFKKYLEKFSQIEKILIKIKFLRNLKFDIDLIDDDKLEIGYSKLLKNEKKIFMTELIFFKIKKNFIKRLKSSFKIEHSVYKEIFGKEIQKKYDFFDTNWTFISLLTFFIILMSVKFLKGDLI